MKEPKRKVTGVDLNDYKVDYIHNHAGSLFEIDIFQKQKVVVFRDWVKEDIDIDWVILQIIILGMLNVPIDGNVEEVATVEKMDMLIKDYIYSIYFIVELFVIYKRIYFLDTFTKNIGKVDNFKLEIVLVY